MNDGSGDTRDYIEHARWLLEWHNKRSEALTTRAVALLGFNGVILSLLLQGIPIAVEPSGWTWVWFGLTVVSLLVSAILALACVYATKVEMPSVQALREQWANHAAEPQDGAGVPQIGEDLVQGMTLNQPAPLTTAKAEADLRVARFKGSALALLFAVIFLAILITNVLLNVPRG